MSKEKKKEKLAPSHSLSLGLWPSFPNAIKFLQKQRNLAKVNLQNDELEKNELKQHLKGINSLIILSSALCIEGFLKECLTSFVLGGVFARHKTFQERLEHDFYNNSIGAAFDDFPKLFFIATGKKLSDSIGDTKLRDSVIALIKFRNGICHARSPIYFGFGMPNSGAFAAHFAGGAEYEMESQYKDVHKYLIYKKLIADKRAEELFTNEVADHFAGLVNPYICAILSYIPMQHSDNTVQLYKMANQHNRFI